MGDIEMSKMMKDFFAIHDAGLAEAERMMKGSKAKPIEACLAAMYILRFFQEKNVDAYIAARLAMDLDEKMSKFKEEP